MPATVGLNAGDGSNFIILPHSNTDAVINISSTTNINMTGIWVFQVDQAQISGILYIIYLSATAVSGIGCHGSV